MPWRKLPDPITPILKPGDVALKKEVRAAHHLGVAGTGDDGLRAKVTPKVKTTKRQN